MSIEETTDRILQSVFKRVQLDSSDFRTELLFATQTKAIVQLWLQELVIETEASVTNKHYKD